MYTLPVLLTAFLTSLLSIWAVRPIAVRVGLVDKPGGHKAHDAHVPLVGGIALFLSLGLVWFAAPRLGLGTINSLFVAAGGLLFTIGLIDDHRPLSVRLRFGAQIVAASLLVYSKVIVADVGTLFGAEPLSLGFLAIPVTLFAVVGAINALNMIDGMDGLAGSVSVVAFGLLGLVAFAGGLQLQILIILCVLGGLLGFLVFNMPIPGRARAHIFMGDAGSTLLGFLLAFLLINLSQGPQRAMAPVTALWIFAVPLLDTLGVMLRRVWLGRSPFAADRGHIHHLLLDAGFRVRHVVLLLAALQGLLGAIGLALDWSRAPQLLSLVLFAFLFAGYAYLISRPWRFVPTVRSLHRRAGWAAKGVEHLYVGGLDPATAPQAVRALLGDPGRKLAFEVYQQGPWPAPAVFALIAVGDEEKVGPVLRLLQRRLRRLRAAGHPRLRAVTELRQFMPRAAQNDRRYDDHPPARAGRAHCERRQDRRRGPPRLVYRSQPAAEGHAAQPSKSLSEGAPTRALPVADDLSR